MTETYIRIEPGSYRLPQRVEASAAATALGMGLHMAVGNASTSFYATADVPVGKVRITMPRTYKGVPEYITTLDSASDPWCPWEAQHKPAEACSWCEWDPPAVALALADAIARLEGQYVGGDRQADLRTVIAAAKRPSLTDATRERLISIMQGIQFGNPRNPYTYGVGVVDVFADAILSEYAPVASTRERLAEALASHDTAYTRNPHTHEAWWGCGCGDRYQGHFDLRQAWHEQHRIDALMGAVEDRAEVEAKALEAASGALPDHEFASPEQAAIAYEFLHARAASIREGRS